MFSRPRCCVYRAALQVTCRAPSGFAVELTNASTWLACRQPLAALHHAKRALSIKELFLGPNHPDVATAANNVGELLKLSGSPVEATQHYQHALRVWRTHLGSSHPHVAVALLNLGQLTETLGKVRRHPAGTASAELLRRVGPNPQDAPWPRKALSPRRDVAWEERRAQIRQHGTH